MSIECQKRNLCWRDPARVLCVCVCGVCVCVCVCVINSESKFAGLSDECRDRLLFQHKNKFIIILLLVDAAVLLLGA